MCAAAACSSAADDAAGPTAAARFDDQPAAGTGATAPAEGAAHGGQAAIGAAGAAASDDAPPMADLQAEAPAMDGPSVDCGPKARPLERDGRWYSPGGDVLPHPCEPYHPTTNNPYALRCTEFLPGYQSGYVGDEYCILPPPPELGTQFGVHPQGRDYWNQMWVGDMSGYGNLADPWVMPPGAETDQNYRTNAEITEEHRFYRTNLRMRSGSHHMFIFGNRGPYADEGWVPGRAGVNFLPARPTRFFGFAERPDDGRPRSTLQRAPDDEGIGYTISPTEGIQFNLHHFNASEEPILREAWINVWYMPSAEATRSAELIGALGTNLIDVTEPRTTSDFHLSMTTNTPGTRILDVLGHRHAWTTRFHAWIERRDGSEQLIYDSWDWLDEPTYAYNSTTTNPPFDVDAKVDAAYSGVLTLNPGDKLHYNCHRDTTEQRAAALGVAVPMGPLFFGNQAHEAEMCLLIGETVDGRIGGNTRETGPVTKFEGYVSEVTGEVSAERSNEYGAREQAQ